LAQTGTAALVGSVIDPDGKAVIAATILVRNEASNETWTATTDATGRFAIQNVPVGTYVVEVFVPGFETIRRSVQAQAQKGEEIAFRLTAANIVENVTVSAALPAAAVAAPSQSSLTARSAQSLISNEYIRNYTSPISDYSQVLQMAPGTFSVSPNGPGLADTK